MKLYGSTRSPFSRKVVVALHELGLIDHVEFIPVVVSQTQTDDELARIHPLGQIPALLLDDGTVIHDSLTICEYLDSLAGGCRLLPATGADRWRVLCKHALGQGMLETLVKLFGERKRVDDPLQPVYVKAYSDKFHRVLPTLDAGSRAGSEAFDVGDIAVCCALAYADFRFPEHDWRAGHPSLASYYARIADRPSMRKTALVGEPTKTLTA
jgi:glutathione S-transferase